MSQLSTPTAATPTWRLRNAAFWDGVRHQYDKRDIDAWDDSVPYEVTNNPDFAERCAQGVLHYVISCQADGFQGQFTVLEPGAGLGQFCYLFISKLHALMNIAGVDPSCLTYILCDQSEQTRDFWSEQPQLQFYLKREYIKIEPFTLDSHQGFAKVTSAIDDYDLRNNRVILLANYFFDSLLQQPYRLIDGVYVPHEIGKPRSQINKKLTSLSFKPANTACDDSICGVSQRILDEFAERGIEYVLMPEGAMAVIQWLDQLSDHPALIICHDKGFSDLSQNAYNATYHIIKTGQYASCVNFQALGRYTELALHGSCMLPSPYDSGFTCAVFHTKVRHEALAGFRVGLEYLVQSGHSFVRMYSQRYLSRYELAEDLTGLFAVLRELRFSLHALVEQKDFLIEKLRQADCLDHIDIDGALDAFWQHYYFTPHRKSQTQLIALLEVALHAKRYVYVEDKLADYASWHGKDYAFKKMSGDLYFIQSDFASAAYYFTEAMNDNPDCDHCKQYLTHCESLL